MKMRKLLLGVALGAWLTAAAGAGFSAQPGMADANEENGRYQLFQGSYTSIDLKRQETSSHVGIFLLDTRTGKVKRYLNEIDVEGRYIETWVTTETGMPRKVPSNR